MRGALPTMPMGPSVPRGLGRRRGPGVTEGAPHLSPAGILPVSASEGQVPNVRGQPVQEAQGPVPATHVPPPKVGAPLEPLSRGPLYPSVGVKRTPGWEVMREQVLLQHLAAFGPTGRRPGRDRCFPAAGL